MNKCVICDDELTLISKEDIYSPYEGGCIKLIFSFGSSKFDKCIGNTVYSGLICDNCGLKYVHKMKEELIE